MSRSWFQVVGVLIAGQVCLACEGEIGNSEGNWMPYVETESLLPDASHSSQQPSGSDAAVDQQSTASSMGSPSLGSSDSGVIVSNCGNGIVEPGEECDIRDSDSCKDCRLVPATPTCGNGLVEGEEECDTNSEGCVECRLAFCGDGEVQNDEECDDGNSVDGDECDNHCTIHVCGDNVLQGGEECDPPSETCTAACQAVPERCGDGFVQTTDGEQCDDPNDAPGDGCYQCKFECGNGVIERVYGEACEPGSIFLDCKKAIAGRCVRCADSELSNPELCERRDYCEGNCRLMAACGDGRLDHAAGEECEPPGSATCDGACKSQPEPPAECGNGRREGAEQCDPPDGRFCTETCMHLSCGNGVREGGEECDPPDGETCDDVCRVIAECVSQVEPAAPTLLLGDGSFGQTIAGWRSDLPAQAQISHNPSLGASAAGALQVQLSRGDYTATSPHVLGASMCVSVAADTIYDFSASYSFAPATSSSAGASVSLFLYANSTCAGSPIEAARSRGARAAVSQEWLPYTWTLDTGVGAPTSPTLSLRVRLDVWRPADVESVTAYWDDVKLVARGADDQEEPEGFCGDCVIGEGEQCDDGNQLSGDGCSQVCLDECRTCQQDSCGAQYSACAALALPDRDVAAAGPRAGSPLGELCSTLSECVWRTGCAGETAVSTLDGLAGPNVTGVENCYCGTAGAQCFEPGRANGSCKAEVEAALETDNPGLLFARMSGSDANYPVFSTAVSLFDCGERACGVECGPEVDSEGGFCGNGTLQERQADFLSTYAPGLFGSVLGDSVATCGELAAGACYPELGCGCFFEECDDGNAVSGDGCDEYCFVETCGNGVRQTGEACDDGNDVNGDGCDSTCRVEWACGDGVREGNEACDDGNTELDDGCDDRCQIEECGNGILQRHLGEECEPPDGTACLEGCKLPSRDECTECVLRSDLSIDDLASYGLDLTPCLGNVILDEWPAGLVTNDDALTCTEDPSCLALWNCYVRTGCVRGPSGIEGTCYCGTGDAWGETCLANDAYEASGACVDELKAAYKSQFGLDAGNIALLEDLRDGNKAFGGISSAIYLATTAADSCLKYLEPEPLPFGYPGWSRGNLDLGLCLSGVSRADREGCAEACFGETAGRTLNDDCTALE